jgi:hypothetical protein
MLCVVAAVCGKEAAPNVATPVRQPLTPRPRRVVRERISVVVGIVQVLWGAPLQYRWSGAPFVSNTRGSVRAAQLQRHVPHCCRWVEAGCAVGAAALSEACAQSSGIIQSCEARARSAVGSHPLVCFRYGVWCNVNELPAHEIWAPRVPPATPTALPDVVISLAQRQGSCDIVPPTTSSTWRGVVDVVGWRTLLSDGPTN